MADEGSPAVPRHLIDDAALARLLPMERAVALVRQALLDAEAGRLHTPPRVSADVGGGRLTFTCGSVPGDWVGYRSYLAPGDAGDEQVVVVQDVRSGAVRGVYAGQDLGPLRTGAIGAVAVDALAPQGPVAVSLIGTGRQAWAQVRGIHAARGISSLTIHARDPGRRSAFVVAARDLGLSVAETSTPRGAVEGSPVVVLATSSPTPVIEVDWLTETLLVSTLGPKQVGRHEFPLELADWGERLVTDSLAQVAAYDPPMVLSNTIAEGRLVSLGSILAAGQALGEGARRGGAVNRAVFYSVGLAGTEAALLAAITD